MATFTVNGQTVQAEKNQKLIRFLRDELRLTSVKDGCSEGACGTCTVLLNDKAVHACMTMIAQVNGHRVITSEGVESDPRIAPIIPAFVNNMAIQCGYCTPGMVMSAAGLLLHNPDPTEDEIRTAISGNICRCSCYEQILRAIRQAARDMKEAAK